MQYGMNSIQAKQPRYHPVIAWEANNLTNEFVDINRMALDDRYGHNGAPLSKRRNGRGPTDGNTAGLFGYSNLGAYSNDKQKAFARGMMAGFLAYGIGDFYLTGGEGFKGMQRRIARYPVGVLAIVTFPFLIYPY